MPKGDYTCDTTVVDLTIALADGSKTWNLAQDLVGDPLADGKGNPHADRYGNAGVWHFLDMADSKRDKRATNAALTVWDRAVADVATGKRDHKALEEAANEVQKTFTTVDASSPFWIRQREDEQYLPEAARTDLAKRPPILPR